MIPASCRYRHRHCCLGGFGGAIFNDFKGSITLYAATFTGNAQGRFGQGATVFNRGVSNIRSSTFMRNGIPGLLHETASLATDGGGVVTLSSTIMADRPGCVTFGPSYFIDFGFNLGLVDQPGAGTCAFTSASRSIVDSSGQPVLDSELRNNGGAVPTSRSSSRRLRSTGWRNGSRTAPRESCRSWTSSCSPMRAVSIVD